MSEASMERKRERDRLTMRKWRSAHRERDRDNHRKWRAANPEKAKLYRRKERINNRDKLIARCREWAKLNTERVRKTARLRRVRNAAKIREQKKLWRANNPAKVKDSHSRYAAKNPELIKLLHSSRTDRRRARIKGNTIEDFSYREILNRDGFKCHICNKRVARKDLSFDHIIPIAKGGKHSRENVGVAHLKCNLKMGAGRMPAQLLLIA